MNCVPAPAFLSPLAHLSTGEDAFHRSRSFFLRRRCDVRIGVQREAGGKVAEHRPPTDGGQCPKPVPGA